MGRRSSFDRGRILCEDLTWARCRIGGVPISLRVKIDLAGDTLTDVTGRRASRLSSIFSLGFSVIETCLVMKDEVLVKAFVQPAVLAD